MRVKFGTLALIAGLVAGGIAQAAPLDGRGARDLLFSPKGLVFQPIAPQGLAPAELAKIEAQQDDWGKAIRMKAFELAGYSYYGAAAAPVGVELKLEMLTVVHGLHSPAAAQQAALTQCATQNETDCTLFGLFLPKKYKDQPFSLSANATAGYDDNFRKGQGPRYLAISPSTQAFAIVKGPGGGPLALETCNKNTAGAEDCEIAVADE